MSFRYSGPRLDKYKVLIADTYEQMEADATKILQSTDTVLGFDTEMVDARVTPQYMRVTQTGARYGPTMLIQLATTDHVFLFHFHRMLGSPPSQWELPPSLQKILRSDKYIKIGIATHNDNEGLNRTFGLSGVAQLIDLRAVGLSLGLPFNSLRDIAVWYGRTDLDKQTPHDWTCSLYAGEAVRYEAIEYAALDAIICRQAHRRLLAQFVSSMPSTVATNTTTTKRQESMEDSEQRHIRLDKYNRPVMRVIVPVGVPHTNND